MPISGKFEADFAAFNDAVKTAEVTLKSFETSSNKVESSLTRMTNSFSGTRVIQDATLMAEAVERVGGVSKLTAAELERVGMVAGEAREKLRALGQEVPAGIDNIATAAAKGSTSLGTFRDGLGAADKSLAAMGVHIGPEIRALDELAAAAGKTASQIGMIGTASLAAAAFMGGWKIGRWIADMLDLDAAIGKVSAKLLGLGDLKAEETGAKMDVLARASTIAKRAITDFAEAQKIIIDNNTKFAEGMNTSAFRVSQWNIELDKVVKAGLIPQLKKDLADQNSTLDELAKQYGVSTRALEFFQRGLAATDKAQQELEASTKEFAESNAREYEHMADVVTKVLEEIEAENKKINAQILAENLAQQERLLDQTKAIAVEAAQLHAQLYGAPERNYADELQSALGRAEQQRGELGTLVDQYQRDLIEAERLRQDAAWRAAHGVAPSAPPSFAEGGVGDFGAGTLAILHGKEAIVPLDRAGAGAGMVVNVTLNGMLGTNDPQTKAQIRALVGDALIAGMRQTRFLGQS